MANNSVPPGTPEQEAEQVADAVGGAAMMGVFALIILAYACAAVVVLGGLTFLVLRLVAR
jgi:NaMN:DMB phosphoribosyltransferase